MVVRQRHLTFPTAEIFFVYKLNLVSQLGIVGSAIVHDTGLSVCRKNDDTVAGQQLHPVLSHSPQAMALVTGPSHRPGQ